MNSIPMRISEKGLILPPSPLQSQTSSIKVSRLSLPRRQRRKNFPIRNTNLKSERETTARLQAPFLRKSKHQFRFQNEPLAKPALMDHPTSPPRLRRLQSLHPAPTNKQPQPPDSTTLKPKQQALSQLSLFTNKPTQLFVPLVIQTSLASSHYDYSPA